MQKPKKMSIRDLRNFLLGGALGYSFFWLTSHPTKSPVHKRLPRKKIKNVSYLPHVTVTRKDKDYHLHHWINLSIIYAILLLKRRKLLRSKVAHGFLLGSILQGLTYKDRFQVRKTLTPVMVEKTNE